MEDKEDEANAEPEFEGVAGEWAVVSEDDTSVVLSARTRELVDLAKSPRALQLCALAIVQLRDLKSPKLALGTLHDLMEELS